MWTLRTCADARRTAVGEVVTRLGRSILVATANRTRGLTGATRTKQSSRGRSGLQTAAKHYAG